MKKWKVSLPLQKLEMKLMKEDVSVKPIDIERLFKSKNPKLANVIPRFVFAYLKKVIHIDEINDFIEKYGERKGIDFADAVLDIGKSPPRNKCSYIS